MAAIKRTRISTVYVALLAVAILLVGIFVLPHQAYAAHNEPIPNEVRLDQVIITTTSDENATEYCTIQFVDNLQTMQIAGPSNNWTGKVKTYNDLQGSVYYKGGAWKVIGSNKYVLLNDIVLASGLTWSNELRFYVHNPNSDTPYGWYSKYTAFTPTAISNFNKFYGGINPETATNGVVGQLTGTTTPARLGIQMDTATLSGNTTALQALTAMNGFSTLKAPRLLWGFDPDNLGGKRFPSEIIAICIS